MSSTQSPESSHDLQNVLSASEPPFVVMGTTDKPFLARVELVFSDSTGASKEYIGDTDVSGTKGMEVEEVKQAKVGKKVVLEHWVEVSNILLQTVLPLSQLSLSL